MCLHYVDAFPSNEKSRKKSNSFHKFFTYTSLIEFLCVTFLHKFGVGFGESVTLNTSQS